MVGDTVLDGTMPPKGIKGVGEYVGNADGDEFLFQGGKSSVSLPGPIRMLPESEAFVGDSEWNSVVGAIYEIPVTGASVGAIVGASWKGA